jgi:hypothetical protein
MRAKRSGRDKDEPRGRFLTLGVSLLASKYKYEAPLLALMAPHHSTGWPLSSRHEAESPCAVATRKAKVRSRIFKLWKCVEARVLELNLFKPPAARRADRCTMRRR